MPPSTGTEPKGRLNVIGLVALIAAVIGVIFACVPGALIIGWILLPIAFVLSLVSLFLKDGSKWMGITGLILSIVGTVVGLVVFLVVASNAFTDAFGSGSTSVAQPSEEALADPQQSNAPAAEEGPSSGEPGTRGNPYPVGSVIENDEWRVVVNSVTPAATKAVMAHNSLNEAPAEGSEYMLVNYSVTYLGDDPQGKMPVSVGVSYVTADGRTINSYDKLVVPPESMDGTSPLYTGGTETGNAVFEVPAKSPERGVLAIRPGTIDDKVFVAAR